jgi:UDP-N-acetylglucosamine 2-epimerase (non-hydrolysing)
LESTLFEDLQIPRPDVFLGVDSQSLNEITGRVMGAFDQYLEKHPADVVIVVDDLASTMAAAIVTKKRGIRLAHLVAGTRYFDITMPKEVNRLVIDGLSDLLFTAGISSSSHTNTEGVSQNKVYMVGNILIDNLRYCHNRWQRPALMEEMKLQEGKYIVLTINRKALLNDQENLQRMLTAIAQNAADVPVVAFIRQVSGIHQHPSPITYHPSLPYLEFGYLTAHALGVITDSGNVAEEATFNHVPCITLNSYTEHIETVKVGTNVLVGEDAELLGKQVAEMVSGNWKHGELPDRWDGRTAERILQILDNG